MTPLNINDIAKTLAAFLAATTLAAVFLTIGAGFGLWLIFNFGG